MSSLLDVLLTDGLSDAVIEPVVLRQGVFIAIRSDGCPGTGTSDDPFNGSGSLFDTIMQKLQADGGGHQVVHVGPGTFNTKGSSIGAWLPQSGQRIVGSGMFATTLKLQLTTADTGNKHAVFECVEEPGLDGYEISDLTFDCNLAGQPHTGGGAYSAIAVGAVLLRGRNILIHRVRVINFGTQTADMECFPIMVAHAIDPDVTLRPSNCVVEKCVIEQPAVNNARETSCIILSGGELFQGRRGIRAIPALGRTDPPVDGDDPADPGRKVGRSPSATRQFVPRGTNYRQIGGPSIRGIGGKFWLLEPRR